MEKRKMKKKVKENVIKFEDILRNDDYDYLKKNKGKKKN